MPQQLLVYSPVAHQQVYSFIPGVLRQLFGLCPCWTGCSLSMWTGVFYPGNGFTQVLVMSGGQVGFLKIN